MYKDSYSQRLKEIREKYGSTVKDTTSCLRSNERQSSRAESFLDGKYASKVGLENAVVRKKYSENINPLGTDAQRKYSTLALKEKEAQQSFDSFLYTQSKEERLREIEKIRQSVAESKKQAIDDWNKEAERSRSKRIENEKYEGLRERTNTYLIKNPEENRFNEFKESTINETIRNRGFSSYSSTKIESDLQFDRELRRNYDYSGKDTKKVHEFNRDTEFESKRLGSYRNNSVNKFDREIENISTGKNFACTTSIELKNTRHIDSETTSPIRGLMKLDSLEKTRRTEAYETQNNLSKFANNSYDLTNIDKIQERIQKILAKK